MDQVNVHYWTNLWQNDFELHHNLGIKNVTSIGKDENVSIYADTDSCQSDSVISTDKGRFTIEDWYNNNTINGSAGTTMTGHESVKTNDMILNYDENKGIYFAPVKRIIRHKVSKKRWRLKTKSGKEIYVTDDHSMIVFRDGVKLEVKPSQIIKTDKILVIKNNIYR